MTRRTWTTALAALGCAASTMLTACFTDPDTGSTSAFETEVPCDGMDAQGVGFCEMYMGLAWDGSDCVGVSGCSCEGADCDKLTLDRDECLAAHTHCSAGPSCDPMDARGEGFCEMYFGITWDGSQCVGLGGCSCTGADCNELYQDMASCESDHALCGAAPSCDAMDARGEGFCEMYMGVVWDGSGCVGISGCSCDGTDCGDLYDSLTDCQSDHAGC